MNCLSEMDNSSNKRLCQKMRSKHKITCSLTNIKFHWKWRQLSFFNRFAVTTCNLGIDLKILNFDVINASGTTFCRFLPTCCFEVIKWKPRTLPNNNNKHSNRKISYTIIFSSKKNVNSWQMPKTNIPLLHYVVSYQ